MPEANMFSYVSACRHDATGLHAPGFIVYVLIEPNGYRIPEFQKSSEVGNFGVVVSPRLVWENP